MRSVSIIGAGMTPAGEHWADDLRSLAAKAAQEAIADAGISQNDVDAFVCRKCIWWHI